MAAAALFLRLLGLAASQGDGAAAGCRHAGPPGESAWARRRRWRDDRRRLAAMDDRLLADIGLSRDAVRQGAPFAAAPGRGGAEDGRLRPGRSAA